MTKRIALDIETNGLNPDKIWWLNTRDIDTGERRNFRNPTGDPKGIKDSFLEFIKDVTLVIGHNIIGYDRWVIQKLLGYEIPLPLIEDTLVLSRLTRPVSPTTEKLQYLTTDSRIGGHSLDAWGKRLNFHKLDFKAFDVFSEEMGVYCDRDIDLTILIYRTLLEERKGFSEESIRLEHNVQYWLSVQERNGFYLDTEVCNALLKETTDLLTNYDKQLQELFPPIQIEDRIIPLKKNKDGTISKVTERMLATKPHEHLSDGTVRLFNTQTFNPGSGKQVAERLISLGWKPTKFTDKGAPKTDFETLNESLKSLENHPQVKCLVDYGVIQNRQAKALKWLELVQEDGRVHGRINPIGAGTHRCSHYDDNMANVASVTTKGVPGLIKGYEKFDVITDGEYKDNIFLEYSSKKDETEIVLTGIKGGFGWESRNCWSVPNTKKYTLVGCDASGIQLRALAHYMNDPEYTNHLVSGDIHVINQKAAELPSRSIAKTFIYAWLLGAGDYKIGLICGGAKENEYSELIEYGKSQMKYGEPLIDVIIKKLRKDRIKADKQTVCTVLKGHRVKAKFLENTPALRRLKEVEIPRVAKQGFLEGLDGRKLWIPSEHLAMSLYLQGFEAVIMKAAICMYSSELKRKGIYFKQVNFVHDEVQIECLHEDADFIGETVVKSIRRAGEHFNSKCPLDGEWKKGKSWAYTH